MPFKCHPVDADFLDKAPWRFVNSAELDWGAERVFAVLADAPSWPRWYPGMVQVDWTTPKPFGVGSRRTVKLAQLTVYERFFRWEPGRRFSFDFEAASLPFFRSAAEDCLLEPIGENRCRFTYTVAIEPSFVLTLTSPVMRKTMGDSFKQGVVGLQRFCATP